MCGKKILCYLRYYLLGVFLCLPALSFATDRLIVEPNMGRAPLLDAIAQAKSNIDVVMYGFTDQKIYKALVAARKRGVKVRILLQRYPYKAKTENTQMSKNLIDRGIIVKWSDPKFYLTHQKTLIIDGKEAIIMTFNFTYLTFKTQRNFAIATTNPQLVDEVLAVFNADWNRKTINLKNSNLVWSPDNALGKIVKFIDSAKVNLAVYNQEMSNYAVVRALARESDHKIKVRVIMPASLAKKYCRKLRYLRRHKVQVRLDSELYIHAKAMLKDYAHAGTQTFVGSMNFSDSGLTKNRELGMIVASSEVAKVMNATFSRDWQVSKPFVATRCSH